MASPSVSSPTNAGVPDPARVASVLRELRTTSSADGYTVLKLSEPITSAVASRKLHGGSDGGDAAAPPPARTSDVSASSLDAGPTPSSLDADLEHYRELFAKLRFSYVEQVTKEKFIRAIVGDPPLIVAAHEIAELEGSNAAAKRALQRRKGEVEGLIRELEGRGRDVAGRYGRVRERLAELEGLPGEVERLEREVAGLRERQRERMEALGLAGPSGGGGGGGGGKKGDMALPLGKTRELVGERRAELAALERRLEALERQVPSKKKELERAKAEVAALEKKRAHSTAAAREAKRRKEGAQAGGGEDELEARGRWYRASEAVLREVLDLKG
ncbi:hypothetical protein VTJ83DRAFT_1610 [Remersonia thermophila]|uniref:Kinetochore protein Sos7 coiled-coil domain-containing protein n=1 Tax=Remersonia thermophila TaxID=72144 RepID=A0ABR4DGM9_9PEZI